MRWQQIVFMLLIIISRPIYAQNFFTSTPKRLLEFPTIKYKFYSPAKTFNKTNFKTLPMEYSPNTTIIYKSPVKHTAIFCIMEDFTLKNMGVMIQVHAGDYNSYMDKKIER